MALRTSFWLPLAGLLIVAPQPSSASYAISGGFALDDDADHECQASKTATSSTCKATNSLGPLTATTSDGADLRSGNLVVDVSSQGTGGVDAGGFAELQETITFHGEPPTGVTLTPGGIEMTGTMLREGRFASSVGAYTYMRIENLDHLLITAGGACIGPVSGLYCNQKYNGTTVSMSGTQASLSSSYAIDSAVRISDGTTIVVTFGLAASSVGDSSVFVTDPITIDPPPGFTFTSASGVFLTGAGSVPETSTWVMILAGFASLAVLGCRARRRTAASG
jgi:hypothetical protein